MRVISGEAKGRKLKSGKGQKARPTSDRVKEALFNIIMNYLPEAEFLDLFAGFGGIGIEAISRGVKRVTFVEEDSNHVRIIKENLRMTGFIDRAEVIAGDVLRVLPRLANSFNLIYIDPPYAEEELYHRTLELIFEHNLLSSEGVLVCEHNIQLLSTACELFELLKTKTYGESNLTFFGIKREGN